MTIREPAADGIYYDKNAAVLRNQVKSFLKNAKIAQKTKAFGMIVPHDRYALCANVLGKTYAHLQIPDHIILLGPNHSGLGQKYAIDTHDFWKTSLGPVKTSHELAALLIEHCPILRCDSLAHDREHALECQLPFLQFLSKKFQIVPLALMDTEWEQCLEIAESLVKTMVQFGKPILIICSSNLNHYEDLKTTQQKDAHLIEKIKQLDAKGLFEMVRKEPITLCGLTPILVMLLVAKMRESCVAHLLTYQTSADVNHNSDTVVGYAGILFK